MRDLKRRMAKLERESLPEPGFSCVVLVVDAGYEITPADEERIAAARRAGGTVVVDLGERDDGDGAEPQMIPGDPR